MILYDDPEKLLKERVTGKTNLSEEAGISIRTIVEKRNNHYHRAPAS